MMQTLMNQSVKFRTKRNWRKRNNSSIIFIKKRPYSLFSISSILTTLSVLEFVFPFLNFLNQFGIECGQIVRGSAGYKTLIHHNFFIHPICAGINQIVFNRAERSKLSAIHNSRGNQGLWAVANCRNRFLLFKEILYKFQGTFISP